MVYNTQKYKRVIAFPIQGQVWTHRGDLEYRYEVIVVGAFCICRNKLKLINSTTNALVLVYTRFYASLLIYSIYYRYIVPIITVQCMEYRKKKFGNFFRPCVCMCVSASLCDCVVMYIIRWCVYSFDAYVLKWYVIQMVCYWSAHTGNLTNYVYT